MSSTVRHRRTGRRAGVLVVLALALLAASVVHPMPSRAVNSTAGGLPADLVVSANPADWTPHVLDGRVTAITQVGNRMVVGGRFSKVRQAGSGEVLNRRNLFAFDADTGVIDRSFNPGADDMVSALVAAPGGNAVFVGGRFRTIAGQSRMALAKLDVPSGQPTDGFVAGVDHRVDDLVLKGSRLFVAGVITSVNGVERSGLGAVDPVTGALDPGVDVRFSDPRNNLLVVNRLAVRSDGSRLVALGSFLQADGQDRPQLAVLDLDGTGARLADWHTDGYAARCDDKYDTYMRGVDISADGSYMVVVTTGSRARPLCDAVARFELGGTGRNILPTWVDYSGGDTFTGVAVTDAAIYVGGHQRWMNNPFNNDTGITATPGVGSVPRPGISALDPVNGLPLSWNPGRDPRGIGVFMFLATPKGLWIGSDTDFIGGEKHPRLALLPTEGGKVLADPVQANLPTVLYRRDGGELVVQPLDGTDGSPAITALSHGADWSQARAAFRVDGRLYTAWADGRIDVRPLDDDSAGIRGFGPGEFLDLGGLAELPAANFPVSRLSGMAFDAKRGRLYYTIEGDPRLYYRYFTVESGVVGGLGFVPTRGAGLDWSDVRGLAVASGGLYSAHGDGRLHRLELP